MPESGDFNVSRTVLASIFFMPLGSIEARPAEPNSPDLGLRMRWIE